MLVPHPTFLIGGLTTDGSGELAFATSWPAGLPAGTTVHLQYWIVDATGRPLHRHERSARHRAVSRGSCVR